MSGKVISFDAARRAASSQDKPSSPAPDPSGDASTDAIDDVLQSLASSDDVDEVGIFRKIVVSLDNHLTLKMRLKSLIPRNEERIGRYYDTVHHYDDEEVKAFANADDNQIRQRPFFYYAIADEIERRGI